MPLGSTIWYGSRSVRYDRLRILFCEDCFLIKYEPFFFVRGFELYLIPEQSFCVGTICGFFLCFVLFLIFFSFIEENERGDVWFRSVPTTYSWCALNWDDHPSSNWLLWTFYVLLFQCIPPVLARCVLSYSNSKCSCILWCFFPLLRGPFLDDDVWSHASIAVSIETHSSWSKTTLSPFFSLFEKVG